MCVCVCVRMLHKLAKPQGSTLKGLTDGLLHVLTNFGWWHTGCHDTRLFCLPFDPFKGCCGQSGITCEGQREGRRGRGQHFLCKKWGPKGSPIHPLCTEQKVGSLWEGRSETKTHVHVQTWQRSAWLNELGWSSQGGGELLCSLCSRPAKAASFEVIFIKQEQEA